MTSSTFWFDFFNSILLIPQWVKLVEPYKVRLDINLGVPDKMMFRHLVVKIALLFVFSIIFPNSLPSLLFHFFLRIYPWLTWFPWSQIKDTILGLQISHFHYNKIYILFKLIFIWGGWGVQLGAETAGVLVC